MYTANGLYLTPNGIIRFKEDNYICDKTYSLTIEQLQLLLNGRANLTMWVERKRERKKEMTKTLQIQDAIAILLILLGLLYT